MKPHDHQTDLFDSHPEFDYMDPQSLSSGMCSVDSPVDEHLLDSVRRCGVLTPVLVTQDPDGTRSLVAGRRRVLAAEETGQKVPVRTVSGTPTTVAIKAFNADFHRHARSAVERGWQVRSILAAAETEEILVSQRWLAAQLGVALGTAHYWLTLAKGLPANRLARLAAAAGVEARDIRTLSVRRALRVAKTTDDAEAVALLRELVLSSYLARSGAVAADPSDLLRRPWPHSSL